MTEQLDPGTKSPITFSHLKYRWGKSYVLRKEVSLFTEGHLSSTQMATIDCRNQGPDRFFFKNNVAYEVDIFIAWMEQRLVSRVRPNSSK